MTEKPQSFEDWVSAQGLDPKRLDRMQESINRRLYDYEMKIKALEQELEQAKLAFISNETFLALKQERDQLKKQIETKPCDKCPIDKRDACWKSAKMGCTEWFEYLKHMNSVARAESAEAKLESFTMRFGSYGTFTHIDILRKIEEQEAEVKTLTEQRDLMGKENTSLYRVLAMNQDRLAKAQPIIEQIQEILRCGDCPEGYTTSCMECEETESCDRSKGINLCLEAKKVLGESPCTKGEVKE